MEFVENITSWKYSLRISSGEPKNVSHTWDVFSYIVLKCLYHSWDLYGFEKNRKSYLTSSSTLFDLVQYSLRYRPSNMAIFTFFGKKSVVLGDPGLRNASVNKHYRLYYNLPLQLTKMIIFARKVGLFRSKLSSSTDKCSYTIALNIKSWWNVQNDFKIKFESEAS
jgi:hypothetical protein